MFALAYNKNASHGHFTETLKEEFRSKRERKVEERETEYKRKTRHYNNEKKQ